MKKIVLMILIYISFIINVNANVELNSKNAIMYNLNDDTVIYEKSSKEKKQIASLTKIMTSIIVIENSSLDDEIIVTKDAFNDTYGFALAGFNIGDRVTIRDLLYGLMLPSGADAANVLAISVSGSNEEFVKLMNNKAKKLGLNDTHFSNTVGIDDSNNYSTAYDLSLLLKYCLKNNDFKAIYNSNEYKTTNGLMFKKTLLRYAKNNNLDASIIEGAKTGHTDEAGYCLSSTATIDGISYMLITLDADSYASYIKDALNIYDYYSSNYGYKVILEKNKHLVDIPIKNGKKKDLSVYSEKEIKKYLSNDIELSKIEYEYIGVDKITKKIKLNDKLGVINIKYNDEILDTYDIYLNEEIKYKHTFVYIIIIVIIIFIVYLKKIKRKKKKKVVIVKRNGKYYKKTKYY